jgi:hypothetical protein
LNRFLLALLCMGLLAASLPRAALAQDALQKRRQEAMVACTEDLARYCGDVPPGGGRLIACMRANADKLSQRCFQAMTAWGLAVANAFKACLPDAERFCPHLPPGGPRARRCMLRNADKLSKACSDALLGEEPFNGGFKACQPDMERLCPNLPPGGPRARACILQNIDRLGKACSDALLGEEPPPGRR